jgi:hypothetical protein
MARTTLKTALLLSELLCKLGISCSMVHREHSSYCCDRWNVYNDSLPSNGHIRRNILNNYFDSCDLMISKCEAYYSVIPFYCIVYSA